MKYFNIRKDILATIAYFDMFDYPLKKSEIFIFLGHCNDYPEFEQALKTLLKESLIFKIGNFYGLQNDYKLAVRRYRGNAKATIMLKKAEKAAAVIAAFPFVKGVAVSGSLSKYFADENSDIDFFIITTANRLWIARTLLHVFKKFTFIFHMQHHFCMNYFIDEEESVILEKNIYTALEIVTILPIRGNAVFDKFFKENSWAANFFPNKYFYATPAGEIGTNWIKYLTEKVLNNRLGNFLDRFFMNQTSKSWNSKTRANKLDSKGMLMSMHTGKHFSKPNPDIFQKSLLQRYENSLLDIFRSYELSKSFWS